MQSKVTGKFDSVEAAENAAASIRRHVGGIGRVTLCTTWVRRDLDVEPVMPLEPVNIADRYIPSPYGYATVSGYYERAQRIGCTLSIECNDADDVRSRMHNLGGRDVKSE
jgi:hypothetical protein